MSGRLIALRAPARQRHPFRAAVELGQRRTDKSLFGALPRELHDPALWRQAGVFVPVTLALLLAALVVLP